MDEQISDVLLSSECHNRCQHGYVLQILIILNQVPMKMQYSTDM